MPDLLTPARRILALDPAARTGVCFSDHPKLHDYRATVWELGADPAGRLDRLDSKLRAAIEKFKPDAIAYESATFGTTRLHTMRRHNELAGVIELVARQAGIPCWSYPPPQWKALALASGRLKKDGVKRSLQIIHGIRETDSDMADAIGICIAAMRGPPPEPKKKAAKRVAKALKARQPTLFGRR